MSYDYCFMRHQPGSESAKILVSKDRATRMVSAHVVPLKGAVIDWVIQQCARDLERLGYYGQVTLKFDQEVAIVDVLREIANLRGSRGTLLEHSPVADSQSNGLIERGIRSVEEMTRVLLFDLSSRVKSPISVHSPVFPWIVEHATDILNKCHVSSDGKILHERLKKRPHRGELLPFGTAVMFRVAGKVSGGLMSERWHLGTWLGKRFHTEEHIVARKGNGLVIRSRAVKVMPEPTTTDDLDAIKGSPWAPSGVLKDVLPDVPRPTIRDDPAVEIEEERPVPRNMKITQDIPKKFGYTPGCAKCRRLSRNEYSHPSLAHSQDCRIRIEAASKADPTYRDRFERAEQRKMDFYARDVEQMDHARKACLEPSVESRPEMARNDSDDRSNVREAKRAREEQPALDLSGEIPIPSADERLTIPIPVPVDVIPPVSSPGQIFQEASSSSGVKRPYRTFQESCQTVMQSVRAVKVLHSRILQLSRRVAD